MASQVIEDLDTAIKEEMVKQEKKVRFSCATGKLIYVCKERAKLNWLCSMFYPNHGRSGLYLRFTP